MIAFDIRFNLYIYVGMVVIEPRHGSGGCT